MPLTLHRAVASTAVAIALVTGLPSGAAAQPLGDPRLGGAALASRGVVTAPGVPAPPSVKAAAYVVADASTGAVLAARDAHSLRPPASTLKTLTALALLPQLDSGTSYRAVHADAAVEGSKVGVVPGQAYSVDLLWRGLFLRSGNDAANALANAAGGVPQTVALMQAEARRLQALDTTVVNPSGLDEPGQLSSAYDLALIARAGLQRTDFRTYCGMRRAQFPGRKGEKPFVIDNQNALLRNYPGAIGVKTGFTTQARHTLVGAATRGDRTLIVTLLKVPHPYVSREAAALLDWGFAHAATAAPVGELVDPTDAPAADGIDSTGGVVAAPVAVGEPPAPASLPVWVTAAASGAAGLVLLVATLRMRVRVRRRRRGCPASGRLRKSVGARPPASPPE